MSGWIEKLDEFVERQGIKSAELCIIIDGIEKQLVQQKELLNVAVKALEHYARCPTPRTAKEALEEINNHQLNDNL